MPLFSQYNVYLLDWNAAKVATLFPGDDFLSVKWQHKLNQPGVYRLELVAETGTKDLFVVDYQVLVERDYGDGWYEEFVGFHLDTDEWYESDNVDAHYWASMGMSPEWLLDQPLLQPVMNSGNAMWTYYDMWWFFGKGDDAVKTMAAESLSAPGDSARTFANVAVQGNTGLGYESCYEGKWVRLIDAMTDAVGEDGAKGETDFRVERVTGGYEVRTYSPYYGTDRRVGNAAGNKATVFSFEHENIRNPRRQVLRHAEVTAAYGGYQGGGMERDIYYRENATALAESPYRRREAFYDLRDVSTPDVIDGWLDQKLADDGKQELVEFDLIQTNACMYGRDWKLGDLCTARVFGGEYDVRITEALGSLDGQNEETVQGRAELWTRGY